MRDYLLVLLFLMASPLKAVEYEWGLDVDLIHGMAMDLFEEWVPESVKEAWTVPDPEDWRVFWRHLEAGLQSEALIDLAWIKPEAEAALSILQSIPLTEPYAAWLTQRLDYLDMAHRVLGAYRNQREPLRPQPPPPTKSPLRPPAPMPPVKVTPEENRDMQRIARDRINWDRKLAGRPAPARADALVPGLKRIFEDEGVPGELVWLAEVESSFNPGARSPVGALGLFQFMPATAEQFGMRLAPTDERLDPHKSARAAAQYLRFLHARFESWPLALAAYNAGQGRVGGLLRRHNGNTFEDIAPHLPSETQMYVPKVMATVALREGIDPTQLRAPTRRG